MSDFKKIIQEYGLEYFGLYYGVYRAKVLDHSDPEFLGRVKVDCPQLFGNEKIDVWVKPRNVGFIGGGFFVPAKGDNIYLSFENGDLRFPLYESGWWTKDNVPESAKVKEQNAIVFQSRGGRIIELNDKEENILIQDKSGFKVIIDKEGLFIGKGGQNLGSFLDDLFSLISVTTAGPYPLTNSSAFSLLGEQIQTFLKSSE